MHTCGTCKGRKWLSVRGHGSMSWHICKHPPAAKWTGSQDNQTWHSSHVHGVTTFKSGRGLSIHPRLRWRSLDYLAWDYTHPTASRHSTCSIDSRYWYKSPWNTGRSTQRNHNLLHSLQRWSPLSYLHWFPLLLPSPNGDSAAAPTGQAPALVMQDWLVQVSTLVRGFDGWISSLSTDIPQTTSSVSLAQLDRHRPRPRQSLSQPLPDPPRLLLVQAQPLLRLAPLLLHHLPPQLLVLPMPLEISLLADSSTQTLSTRLRLPPPFLLFQPV